MNDFLFEYSEVRVLKKDKTIDMIKTVKGFDCVTACNQAWNCYDIEGTLHSYNWDVIEKLEVRQKKEIREV